VEANTITKLCFIGEAGIAYNRGIPILSEQSLELLSNYFIILWFSSARFLSKTNQNKPSSLLLYL